MTNAEWVRAKIAERGWTTEIEALAEEVFEARLECDLWPTKSSA